MKTVIMLVCVIGGLAMAANFVWFVVSNPLVTFFDTFVLLIAPASVVIAGPLLAKRSSNIGRTANLILVAGYGLVVLATLQKGSPIGTAAYLMLALSLCYALLFGWRGLLIAGLVSVAHFALFLSLGDQLRGPYTLVVRHAHVIDMGAITGTLSNYALVFLISGSCAAAFNTQISWAVAELAEARRQAEEASAAKSVFLTNMSHEIRTPMNGVLGMAQVLKQQDLRPDHAEMVDTILESGTTLTSLLNDLLDLSKIQAGKLEVRQVAQDLGAAIRGVVRLFGAGWRK
ncbi:MAG: histidine kinase dimerization/phospho-acceptor domain-containing protein [Hyphomonadaceae bacterium]